MGKLYFKYGVMGSSKTANALMCRYNYLQKGKNVLLMKSAIDTREKIDTITSRIGLSAPCHAFETKDNLIDVFEKLNKQKKIDIVIVDECQFCSQKQIDQLRQIAEDIPVLCYGLKTNFRGELFEGSKRLLEIADSLQEIKCVCKCGKKAIMNGRFVQGLIQTDGNEIEIGGDEKYEALCFTCFKKAQLKRKIVDKLTCHIKPLSSILHAGVWSSDTAADNVILQRPHVIYCPEVEAFLKNFKSFQARHPQELLLISDNAQALHKHVVKDRSFEYIMALIAYVLKLEPDRPGLLKALVEDGTIVKWLKQIKKVANEM